MAKQVVNIGASLGDGTGDQARNAFDKLNDNFDEVYTAFGDGTTLGSVSATVDFASVSAVSGDWRGVGAETLVTATTALEGAVAAGVADGDKGDITVSAAGATWTVDNDVVTNAKLANVATATFKGRTTAGTGDPEDLTTAQARTLLNVADGATANATDAALRDRATHTGTQAAGTITGLATVATSGLATDINGTAHRLFYTNDTGDVVELAFGADGTVLTSTGLETAPAFEAVSGSGVSDGDKGDITVSASGATWTINNAAVTTAKIATQAARTVLANDTSGTASPTALVFGTNTALFRGAGSLVQSVSASRLLGRGSSGDAGLISASTGLTFGPSDIRFASTAAQTILANATGSTAAPAALALATSTILGRGPTGNIVGLTAGSGITISDTQISASGGGALNNYAATVRPVVGDDTADGYSVGSQWIIVSGANADEVWVCLDASAGAADWQQVAVGVAVSATKAVPALADAFPLFDSADGDATKTTTLQGIIGNQTIGTALGTTGTVDLDVTALSGTTQRIAASGTITFTTSNRVSGKFFKLRIAAGGASRTINYPAGWVPIGAALPTTIASDKVLRLDVECFGTADTDIDAVAVAQP